MPRHVHHHVCGKSFKNEYPLQWVLHQLEGNTIPNEPNSGCGHQWHHDDRDPWAVKKEDYYAAHHCPSCGAGPFLLALDENGQPFSKDEE